MFKFTMQRAKAYFSLSLCERAGVRVFCAPSP
jgi:hypothetical protein